MVWRVESEKNQAVMRHAAVNSIRYKDRSKIVAVKCISSIHQNTHTDTLTHSLNHNQHSSKGSKQIEHLVYVILNCIKFYLISYICE